MAWAAPLAPTVVTSLSFPPSSGAGDMCEELWPPLSHPRGQPRFHRQCPGQNHLSQEQPSHHCPGQGASSDPGRGPSPCPTCWLRVRRGLYPWVLMLSHRLVERMEALWAYTCVAKSTRFLHHSHWNKNLSSSLQLTGSSPVFWVPGSLLPPRAGGRA